MTTLTVRHIALLLWCMTLASVCQAEQFCFLLAENYYEQLYCEVKAKGKGRGLPAFYDFKKNNTLTQALILKRPAAKIGVNVTLPKKVAQVRQPARVTRPQPAVQAEAIENIDKNVVSAKRVNALAACAINGIVIKCEAEKYQLTGNKSNRHLVEGALDINNKLAIQTYIPQQHSGANLDVYLLDAYRRYIEKMFAIGLGAATFSYAKFAYLFDDMTANGVDFSGRFETMYSFLKKDKLGIGISESIPDAVNVSLDDCLVINTDIITCPSGNKNYLYVKPKVLATSVLAH